jgi:outer membrane protein TolC
VVRLTLDEAVAFALERNLDIAVQRLNPEINDIAIASISSVYHPSLTSTVGPQNTTVLPVNQTSVGTGGIVPQNKTMIINGGVAEQIPWGGGAFTASLTNFRRESTINNNLFNPLFQSNWNFAYVQPLMRNFRIDSTRQQLQVTKLNRDISDVQLRSTITNTLSNVRNALGLCLRRAGGRGGAAVARPRQQAGAGQPDASRSAPWRRSTSSRRSPSRPRAGRRWSRRSRPVAPPSSR